MTNNLTSHDWESLSAYLDGQLEAKELARLETRLQGSNSLRVGLEQLRRTRDMLRSQPKIRAPRNFTLSPEMVGIKKRARRSGLFPVFGLASALASLLFIVVLLGEFLSPTTSLQVAQAPYPQAESMAAESAPPEAQLEEGFQAKSAEPSDRAAPELGAAEEITEQTLAIEESEGALPDALGTPIVGAADTTSIYPSPEEPLESTAGEEAPMAMMAPETEEALMAEATQLAYLPQIESESTSQQGDAASANGPVVRWLNSWRIAQIGLGSIALITGLIAVYLRRRNRA